MDSRKGPVKSTGPLRKCYMKFHVSFWEGNPAEGDFLCRFDADDIMHPERRWAGLRFIWVFRKIVGPFLGSLHSKE